MREIDRRAFLGSSALGLGSALTSQLAPRADAQSPTSQPVPRVGDDATFQPSTLFLTWQRDPTTTMTIQWIGTQGETADNRIFYGETTDDTWEIKAPTVTPYPKTDFKVFRTELSGLTPDTEHEFRIGRASPVYRFRTMPAKATNAIHFVSGGDCGVNIHAVNNNRQAAQQDPMFAVVGGDLGYDNGRSVETSLAFIRNYSKHMVGRNGRLIPLIAGIGNHEVDGGYNKGRDKAPFFYALFDGLYANTGYAALDFGDYLSLVMLDTGHTSPIGGAQAEWLDRTLRARADHPNVLVVNHVPAYPSHRNMAASGTSKVGTGEENRKHWVPLFEKHAVPVVLEHHDHTFKRTKLLLNQSEAANGVLYLGDGSWGRLRATQKPEKLPHMAKMSSDYHLSLHRLEGNERFHMALDEHGRVMDVCRSGRRRKGLVSVSG